VYVGERTLTQRFLYKYIGSTIIGGEDSDRASFLILLLFFGGSSYKENNPQIGLMA
jgi:hypothetical protein